MIVVSACVRYLSLVGYILLYSTCMVHDSFLCKVYHSIQIHVRYTTLDETLGQGDQGGSIEQGSSPRETRTRFQYTMQEDLNFMNRTRFEYRIRL